MNAKTFCNHRIAVQGTQSKTIGVLAAALLLCVSLFAPSAFASMYTLNPNSDIPASSSLFGTGGHALATNSFLFNSGTLDGVVTSLVFQGDPSNPYGGLTFTYTVTLFSDSSDTLSKMTVSGYNGFLTDVSYNSTFSGGVAPSDFSRDSGDVLRFNFNNNGGLPGGESSALIVVQSSASQYQTVMGAVIDSMGADVAVLAPVPEPAFGSLFAAGLGALFLFRRRSR